MRFSNSPCKVCDRDTFHAGLVCSECGTIIQLRPQFEQVKRRILMNIAKKYSVPHPVAMEIFMGRKKMAAIEARKERLAVPLAALMGKRQAKGAP